MGCSALLVPEGQQRFVDECGEVSVRGEIRVDTCGAKSVLDTCIQAVGDGDAVWARTTVAQAGNELSGRCDIGFSLEPECQTQGMADVYLLEQRASARPPDHRPIAESDQ